MKKILILSCLFYSALALATNTDRFTKITADSLNKSLYQAIVDGDLLSVGAATIPQINFVSNSQTTTISGSTSATASINYKLPPADGSSGYVLSTNGSGVLSWIAQGSGASAALDNLSSVAINASLLPATTSSIDLGSSTKTWKTIYNQNQISPPAAVSSTDIDWSTGTYFTKSVASAGITFTFSNQVSGQQINVVVTCNASTAYSLTFPAAKWAGGTAITSCPAGATNVYTFIYVGSTIYASAIDNMK